MIVLLHRLGLIGDVHAEHERLADSLAFLSSQNVDAVLCTGDLADGRGCLEQTCRLLGDASAHVVRGNHDRWLLNQQTRHVPNAHLVANLSAETLAYLASLPQIIKLPTPRGTLILCHGILEDDMAKVWPGSEHSESKRSESLDALLNGRQGGPRYLVNGHMHYRTLIDFPSLQLINAGTLRGHSPGVVILDIPAETLSGFDYVGNEELVLGRTLTLADGHGRRVWESTAAFDGVWDPMTLQKRRPNQGSAESARYPRQTG